MNRNWQILSQVAPGGPVLHLAGDSPDRLWLAAPAGLFMQVQGSWTAVRRAIPFWRINTVLSHGRNLWLAGMPHGILRSTNSGGSWHHCWIDQTEAPVLTIAASPNYGRDRVLLAGSDGDGILRTVDGGRHWELSNFGLRDFAILDLALAPGWDRYEYAFAVSENGVYQSPNGGRAWRQLDLGRPQLAPLCLALTPTFAHDQTLFVGTQDGELFVSNDAGHHWRLAAEGLEPVNALQVTAQATLLVGAGQAIIRQPVTQAGQDFGVTDTQPLPATVLTLNETAGTLHAGLADGLFHSADDGRSWQPVAGLSARRFVWFQAAGDDRWLAAGPEEGVYLSPAGGGPWQPIWVDLPVLAVAASRHRLAVSTPDGLAISVDAGQTWEHLYRPDAAITALVAQVDRLWAGDQSGQLWRINDTGPVAVTTPFVGQPVLGLFAKETLMVAATWSANAGMVQLWRSDDDGRQWRLWFSQASAPILPQLAFPDETGQTALVGLGTDLYRQSGSEWQRQRLAEKDAPITALWAGPELMIAALTDRLVSSSDGLTWTLYQDASQGQPVVAIWSHESSASHLFAGTSDGYLLRS